MPLRTIIGATVTRAGAVRPVVSDVQTSKTRILAVLKRCGQSSVDDLASALSLAPMTVRQHLTALERDELVTVAERRNGAGRPRHLYSLTERGDAAFPRRYDRFAALLLAEVQDLDLGLLAAPGCPDRMGLVLDKLAQREAAPHVERLSGLALPERARAVAAILHETGGFAEAVDVPDGVELRDYNCVYRGLRPAESGPCAWHVRLVPLLMQVPVEEVPAADGAGRCCCIHVRCSAPAPDARADHQGMIA
jgi:predicted ArsR family transcriptional regulator